MDNTQSAGLEQRVTKRRELLVGAYCTHLGDRGEDLVVARVERLDQVALASMPLSIKDAMVGLFQP
jgi:hypothetical protein